MRVAGGRLAVALLIAAAWTIASVTTAGAQESCTLFGEDVIVREGETRDCDLNIVNGDLVIEQGGVVNGDVIVVFGAAAIEGRVRGDLNVWRDSTVGGRVDGDVYAVQDLMLSSTARIGGDVASVGQVEVEPGAQIGEVRSARELRPDPRATSSGARLRDLLGRALGALGFVALATLFGALATAAAPRAVLNLRAAAGSSVTGVLAAFGVGLIAYAFFAPTLLLVAAITLGFGAVLMLLGGAIAMALGSVGIGQKFGARMVPGRTVMAQTALGTGAVAFVLSVLLYGDNLPIVCGGALLSGMVGAWATGAAILSRFGTVGPSDGPRPPSAAPDDGADWISADVDASTFGRPTDSRSAATRSSAASSTSMQEMPTADPFGLSAASPLADSKVSVPGSAPAAIPFEGLGDDEAAALKLEQIVGLSPIYAALLREGGIGNLATLREADPARLVELVSAPGVLPITRATAEGWVHEAARLART